MVQPLQSFLEAEASSAVLLLAAAAIALVWANSPWQGSYERLWQTEVSLSVGGWAPLSENLRHWVNDGLMSLFFLVVGMEIKRELVTGELRDPRAAAVPVVAALGGMVVPALIYVALNAGGEGSRGWGVPMATDIAFALGVLTLAARSAPASLKPFLLTLAIVDDIGAILIIAVFYSGGVSFVPLLIAIALLAGMVVMERLDVRANAIYVVFGIGVWLAVYHSGVHPTIAGVVLGLMAPTVPFQRPRAVSDEAVRIAEATVDDPEPPDADAPQWFRLAWLSREAVSPLARAEAALHPWTSYAIVPLFALANAGVTFTGDAVRGSLSSRITIGVFLGLVAGKILGVTFAGLAAVRTGLGRLPAGCGVRQLLGVGAVAGIGFTVSLFITELAFAEPLLADEARVGIFAASAVAAVLGFAILRGIGRRVPEADSPNIAAGHG